jgi:hypothetical protein
VVRDTDLLLTLSQGHAQILNAGFGNRVYPFPVQAAQLEAHMYWHESVENDSANRWLRQQIKSVLSPQPRAAVDSRRSAAGTRRRASRDGGGPGGRKQRH